MRFVALATDYDGTLAAGGEVSQRTWEALERLRRSGRKAILVTGRDLEDLRRICPRLDLFARVVAENGGVLYRPDTGEHRLLAPPPPPALVQDLRRRGVPLGLSATLVATMKPHDTAVLASIRELGLDLHLVFNGDAVMVLAPGVSKASGLAAALDELGLSPHNTVAIGDAENDHPMLNLCECAAAVANALPMLKQHADVVMAGNCGEGVSELVDELLADDLCSHHDRLTRHDLLLGRQRIGGGEVRLPPHGVVALAAGPSGSGKSNLAWALLERIAAAGYQFCVFDSEGDYDGFRDAVSLGDAHNPPSVDAALQLLRQPRQNLVLNLLRIPLRERPVFCAGLLPRLQELRACSGRPHWLVLEEAHHLLPAQWDAAGAVLPQQLETALAVTVHPAQVSPALLRQVNLVLATGTTPGMTLAEFASSVGRPQPPAVATLTEHEAMAWHLDGQAPFAFTVEPGRMPRRRHVRKYAEGLLIPERSFYFRGPQGRLRLRAHNLVLFLELADGVDDDTWMYHLQRGDYSRWFQDVIGDRDLAAEARQIEDQCDSPEHSRQQMHAAVERRYTQPENPALPRLR